MSLTSPTLALPFLQPAQAQKHVTHNEALRILDAATQLSVLAADLTDPPASPGEGDCYIVAAPPTGDWAGHAHQVAIYTNAAWDYFTPRTGWRADVTATGDILRFNGSAWVAAPLPQLQNLPELGINTAADSTNRLAVAADATLLTHEGDGHQLKLNKASAGDTASLLFQTGFSGRAEMGTAGSDDFAIKVSDDGSSFGTAFSAESSTGFATTKTRFFAGALLAPQTGVAHATHTTIGFDTTSQNDGGMLDTATGILTPPAGAISAIAGTYATGLSAGGLCTLGIWKNGALLTQNTFFAAAGGDLGMDVGLQDACSGSDTYEIRVHLSTAGTATLNDNAANTYFRGFHH